jgi:hypothetical protein
MPKAGYKRVLPNGYLTTLAKEMGVSRQRVWQLLQRADKRCPRCGRKASTYYCGQCKIKANNEKARRYAKKVS